MSVHGLRLDDLTDEDNGLLRAALRFYLRHLEKGQQGLIRRFGEDADLSAKADQIARVTGLIGRIKDGSKP